MAVSHLKTLRALPFAALTRLGLSTLLIVANCGIAAAAEADAVSAAEVLLFETDHLAKLPLPSAIVYSYVKTGNVEPELRDTVKLDLSREEASTKAVLHFLTGEKKVELPAVSDAHGNPVLLGFMEHDIAEMKRRTGGSVNYFRKRIRMALANAHQITHERINYDGRSIDAQVVRIQPYLNDPMHARFEQYTGKTYTFVLSAQVPGQVYRVHTSLAAPASVHRAGSKAQQTALIEETLSLVSLAQP